MYKKDREITHTHKKKEKKKIIAPTWNSTPASSSTLRHSSRMYVSTQYVHGI